MCCLFQASENISLLRNLLAGTKCADLLDELNTDVGDLNLYDILEPCYNGAQPGNGQQHVQALRRAAAAGIKGGGMMWPLGGVVLEGALVPNWAHLLGQQLGEHPPCLDHKSAFLTSRHYASD